jgi:hypothetical protein
LVLKSPSTHAGKSVELIVEHAIPFGAPRLYGGRVDTPEERRQRFVANVEHDDVIRHEAGIDVGQMRHRP